MNFGVIVFPGSNCDHDTFYVLENFFDANVEFVWHKETSLAKYDAIIIPGGFSYGDYLRAGAIARFSPIMAEVVSRAKLGMPVFGICNGFQILIESGLLEGSLIVNKNVKFISKDVTLSVVNDDSIFTHKMKKGQKIVMPIAHKQGNFFAEEDKIKKLFDNDQVAFTYTLNSEGINGSMSNIAGILSVEKNVLGMMPHPERASESILGSEDGMKIFESLIGM